MRWWRERRKQEWVCPTRDTVPMICDPCPGGVWVLTVPGRLSAAQMDEIKRQWKAAAGSAVSPVLVLEERMRLEQVGAAGWPGAEYYAA